MPLGIFRRLKRGNAKKGSSPQIVQQPLTIITNQRPAYYSTSNADQEYSFNEGRTADNDSRPMSQASVPHRLPRVGRASISNGYDRYGNADSSAQSGTSMLPRDDSRDDSMLEPVSSPTRNLKAQRPGSYYDIGRKRRLLTRQVSSGTHTSENQQRNISDASRLSDRDSIRQDTICVENVNRRVNAVTHALRALKVRSVDMLHPKPTLRFEYEPVDNPVIAIDPFTAGDVRGLRRSQIRSLQVDDIADDLDSHAIRVALERDARRSMDRRRSVSNSLYRTSQSLEGGHLPSPSEPRPWPWRDSREFMDIDRDRRHSQISQRYDQMLQDLESRISEKADGVGAVEAYSMRSSVEGDPQSESGYNLDGPTLISPQELPHEDQTTRTTTDYMPRRRSDLNRRRPSSSGQVITAWTSFLKRATAERIRREIEVREFGGQPVRDQHPISTSRNGLWSRGSPSDDGYYSSDSQISNDDIQHFSKVPPSKSLNSKSGVDSGRIAPAQRVNKQEVEVEHHRISKRQHQVAPAEENYTYGSAVVSRRAQFVRQEELNEGYKVEMLN
ncbi:hypothetical protein V1525DRAFT_353913 [Lipomyces kononenkoae]|uniref:Uncharacterized protein n=1 Tax=Lipomyces kononenkoae TaxID=34357 RepID=A0ACC3TBL0_LIPKO